MSSNVFMLPALSQMPASGFHGTDTRCPAALKANSPGYLSDSGKTFSTTLNRISEHRYGTKPKATSAEKRVVTSLDSNSDSSSSQKLRKTSDRPHDQIEEVQASPSTESAPSVRQPSGSNSEPSALMLTDWIEYLFEQTQPAEGELLGIGPFEQLQFSLSPETTNRALFDQLASAAFSQQDGEGINGKAARFFEFWQRMFSSASTAPYGTLSGQPESSGMSSNTIPNPLLQMMGITGAARGINPDAGIAHDLIMATDNKGAHLNRSLHDRLSTLLQPEQAEISKNGKIGVADHNSVHLNRSLHDRLSTLLQPEQAEIFKDSKIGVADHNSAHLNRSHHNRLPTLLQPEQAEISKDGKIGAADHNSAHLNRSLHDRLPTLLQPKQTEIFENGKIAVADHKSHLPIWATRDLNSETLLETQNRQMNENFQPQKIQAALKAAAEQAANPNFSNEGIPVKSQEEVFRFKNALQKGEIMPVHELGKKIVQIDGDSRDSGFLFSQDQMPQQPTRLENSAVSTEATQRNLMSQTLNQIVQKAVLSVHDGQNEIQLHLKPEFLGHIRMQIVSEGQQVAIKMVVELPFVKDMLENNLQQLKADLQSHGLDIDELEVFVAHDFHAERDVHQNAKTAKLQAIKTSDDSDEGSVEAAGQAQSRDDRPMAEAAIDYFA